MADSEVAELSDSQLEDVIGGVTTNVGTSQELLTDYTCPQCGKKTVYYTPGVNVYCCVRCGVVDL